MEIYSTTDHGAGYYEWTYPDGTAPYDWTPTVTFPILHKTCPKCMGWVELTDAYCRFCGHHFNKPKYCPECGKKMEEQ